MISLVDVMVQNPIIAPSTRNGAVSLLPTYGAMQNAVGAAFTGDLSAGYFLVGCCTGRRGGDRPGGVPAPHPRPHRQGRPGDVEAAVGPLGERGGDIRGNDRIHSTVGPVTVYSCPHDLPMTPDPPPPVPAVPASRLALEFIEPANGVGHAHHLAT